jgi:Ca-activated chloride channel family protein
VLSGIDFTTFTFGEPLYLWMLVAPAALLVLWIWRALRRYADGKRYVRTCVVPVRQRYASLGDLPFWLCTLIATGLCIVALAHPQVRMFVAGTAGADFVILQDASSSMSVGDVAPDRWRRSMRFVRTFIDALSWRQDRVGMAVFARFAAPQVRLTRDPNALLFFLDHFADQPPFRLEEDPTWNTNIEEGVHWGVDLIEMNEKLFGRSTNPKAFVVISDGQAWSGEVATALALARGAGITVHVVGVGTTGGGYIPVTRATNARLSQVHSTLDRASLRAIARAGGGDYFEMGREPDRDVAVQIINNVRRRAPPAPVEESLEEIYWPFLLSAAVFLGLGTIAVTHRAELWWYAAGAAAAAVLLAIVAG